MWKYIVTWMLISHYCTGPGPTVDQYGRTSNTIYAIAIWHCDSTTHSKEFASRAEADKFIQDAPKANDLSVWGYTDGYCTDLKIDSVLVDGSNSDSFTFDATYDDTSFVWGPYPLYPITINFSGKRVAIADQHDGKYVWTIIDTAATLEAFKWFAEQQMTTYK